MVYETTTSLAFRLSQGCQQATLKPHFKSAIALPFGFQYGEIVSEKAPTYKKQKCLYGVLVNHFSVFFKNDEPSEQKLEIVQS